MKVTDSVVILNGENPTIAQSLYDVTVAANNGQTTWKVSSFQTELSDSNHLYLGYYKEDSLVGYIGCQIILDEMSINNFAVHSDYKQQGIGTDLIKQLLAVCEEKEIRFFYLEVRVSNQAAIHLYKKMGFEEVALRKDYYQQPKEDAYIFQLIKNKPASPRGEEKK